MYYSFDVFDTAIIRMVSKPKDIFSVIEREIDSEYLVESDFANKRILAEKKAREKSAHEEITLEEIYSELEIVGIDIKRASDTEISTELDMCKANSDILAIYNKLIQKGARVVFISDMYLGEKVIEAILQKCGYTKYEKVYTSSDVRYTKRTGKLFDFVLSDLGINSYELKHIGDNLKNDYIRPKLKLINSKYYKPRVHEYGNSITEHVLTRFAMYGRQEFSFGYSAMGPFSLGFVDWIHKKTQGKDKIFFLSRDGYLLKAIYEILYPGENTFYLRVSRKALRNASMSSEKRYVEYCKTIPPFDRYDGYMIMNLLELSVDDLKSAGFEGFNELSKFVLWKDVPYSKLFESLYLLSFEVHGDFFLEQHANLYDYLLEKDFRGNIAVVDLSFKGTAFNLLRTFCDDNDINVQMDGFIIGKSELMQERIGESAKFIHGWIFENENNNPFAKVLISAATLYERFLFDSCGTTLSYKREEDEMVSPVLAEDGEKKNIGVIEKERESILSYIEDVMPYYKLFTEELDGISMALPLMKYFMFPSGVCVNEIGNMVEDNTIIRYIAKPNSFRDYCINPKRLVDELGESFWKQGFLYRLFHCRLIISAFNFTYFKKKGITRKERILFYHKLK